MRGEQEGERDGDRSKIEIGGREVRQEALSKRRGEGDGGR